MTLKRIPEPVWDFATIAPYIPSYGWIHDYLSYATQCTDAPPMYHLISTIATTSLAVSPDHYLSVNGELHPLHVFLLAVGESGNRKSAAIKRCLSVVKPRLAAIGLATRVWYPEASTAEGIFDGLMEDPNRLMVASEWTELHNQGKASYNQHTTEFMNLLYDGSTLHRLKKGGKGAQLVIDNPRVSILGASTPSLIKGNTSLNDWQAGKLARYIIGYQHKPEEAEMISTIEHPNLVRELQDDYDRLLSSNMTNNFILSQEAWDRKIDWEHGESWRRFKRGLPDHLTPSALRASEHVYRVATLYQASMDYPHNTVVGEEAMDRAINFIEWCNEGLREKFSTLPSHEPNPIIRVLQALKMHGPEGVSRRDLMRQVHLNGSALDMAIKSLKERDEVTEGKVNLRPYYCHKESL